MKKRVQEFHPKRKFSFKYVCKPANKNCFFVPIVRLCKKNNDYEFISCLIDFRDKETYPSFVPALQPGERCV